MGRPVTELQHTTGIARHGRLKRSHAVTGLLRATALVLAVLLVSGAALAGFAFWQFSSTVAANSIDIDGDDETPAPGIGSYENGSTCSSSALTTTRLRARHTACGRPPSTT
jgi:hypothetical protein